VVVVAIRLDSPGPAIFRQERIGRHGRRFTMLKFRSMRADADERVHRESVRRTALGIRTPLADGREVFKSPDDPRVTRVGRIIRPTCIDELPQLLNVLRGEMSLVGPRPALAYELPFYKSWHFARFDVLPGITGLWQVTRTTDTSFDDMMRLDIEYAASSTVLRDLQLMLLTIPSIIRDRGVF
jgi:lipopolysaccharide/colanic/teichoic acid biosynthesis glycosyltransferase